MAKKEEQFSNIVTDIEDVMIPVEKPMAEQPKKEKKTAKYPSQDTIPNCLRNERIIVRHIDKQGKYTDPRHVLSGGMAEGATKTYVVPKLQSGVFVNVLTNNEKAFLEEIMGLEHDALSIYNRVNNFWDDSNELGISRVKLKKQDNYLDLSVPDDYIRYKILLANKNYICPSVKMLHDNFKATYEYVIISEYDEGQVEADKADSIVDAIELYSKYKNDFFTLKTILELLDRRKISADQKIEFLRAQVVNKIQDNSRAFIKIVEDEFFETKVLIKKAVQKGLIADRGGFFFYRENDKKTIPLCGSDQEPTMEVAAKFLNEPRQQELLFTLQAALQ